MPPGAVRSLRDLLYWQYAKIISESAGFGKRQYGFVMSRFKKLRSGDIEWSSSIREWVREREKGDECTYCGQVGDLTVEHMVPLSRGGPDHPDNAVFVCKRCNSSKGSKRLYEYYGLENRYEVPRIAEGKYLKLLYRLLEERGLLDVDREKLPQLCSKCDLYGECPEKEKLTVYCLEGMFGT